MSPTEPTHVVILGGGFAGKAAADSLSDRLAKKDRAKEIRITLIDKRNYQLFTPMLYQAATGLVDPQHIATPLRKDAKKRGFEFVKAAVESINLAHKLVITNVRDFPYDYLVIALGSIPADERIDGAKSWCIPLKTIDDSEAIHNKVIASVEAAAILPMDDPRRRRLLTFVVIGGSTGAELAGSLLDYLRLLSRYYPSLHPTEFRVMIVERKDRLFPGGDKSLSGVVKRALEERGVELHLNAEVARVGPDKVELKDGTSMEAENIFWNAGTSPTSVLREISESVVKKHEHRIMVDEHLRIPVFDHVYVIGDDAAVRWPSSSSSTTKKKKEEEEAHPAYVPPTAEAALEEGKYVGRHIAQCISRRRDDDLGPFKYKEKGTMLSIGHRYGVVKFKHFTLKGFAGWIVWRAVHVALLSSSSNRFNVLVDWTLGSFTERNLAELGEVRSSVRRDEDDVHYHREIEQVDRRAQGPKT